MRKDTSTAEELGDETNTDVSNADPHPPPAYNNDLTVENLLIATKNFPNQDPVFLDLPDFLMEKPFSLTKQRNKIEPITNGRWNLNTGVNNTVNNSWALINMVVQELQETHGKNYYHSFPQNNQLQAEGDPKIGILIPDLQTTLDQTAMTTLYLETVI